MFHKHGGDVYTHQNIEDFSANINFIGMPEGVRKAALDSIDASLHYPDPNYRALRNALVKREQEYKLQPEEILCGNGAAELMFALTLAKKPQMAVLAVPSFFEYEQALYAADCKIKHVFLKEEEHFAFTEGLFLNLPEETDMIILGNPNNPTGNVIPTRVLKRLIDICQERNITLVLDESFYDFLNQEDQKKTFSGLQYIHQYSNLFVIKSFTKMYAMPGLRFGYGISSDQKLLEKMRELLQPWNVSVPAQAAAEAAATELEFVAKTVGHITSNRSLLQNTLSAAGYVVYESCANFLLFQGPEHVARYCLEHGFLIRDCSNFPGLSSGYYRICVRSQEENNRIAKVLCDAIHME